MSSIGTDTGTGTGMDPESLVSRGADALSPSTRKFYEDSRVKLMLSLLYGGFFLVFLGFCSSIGGRSHSSGWLFQALPSETDDHIKKSVQAVIGGFGFSSFCYLVSAFLSLSAAFVISPIFCGTSKERLILTKPDVFESTAEVGGAGGRPSNPTAAGSQSAAP